MWRIRLCGHSIIWIVYIAISSLLLGKGLIGILVDIAMLWSLGITDKLFYCATYPRNITIEESNLLRERNNML